MKVIVGIDESPASRAALEYVLRLKIEGLRLVLVNSVESVLPEGSFVDAKGHPVADLVMENRKSGARLLVEARERANEFGIDAETQICLGNPAETLQDVAEERNADLIAVGVNRKSAWDEFLIGSTAKKLLRESRRHLLVAQMLPASSDRLKTLVAIDQREESSAYLDILAAMRLRGVEAIELVTVNGIVKADTQKMVHGLPVTTEVAESWVSAGLRRNNEALAEKMARLGTECVPRVIQSEAPDRALVEMAEQEGMDLVVVGAQRHGFIDRHLHHSVSESLLGAGLRALMVLRHESRS